MTFSQSVAITAGVVVIFTLAVVALAVRVFSRPWDVRRMRARSCGAPPAAARPAARAAGAPATRGGRQAAA